MAPITLVSIPNTRPGTGQEKGRPEGNPEGEQGAPRREPQGGGEVSNAHRQAPTTQPIDITTKLSTNITARLPSLPLDR